MSTPEPAVPAPLSWLGIVRLGLVQSALGAIFVLSTATLNRVMKVELALPAVVPGLLIALQYWIQILRPRFGHGSDVGGRRTPHILGGMAVLALGGIMAAGATAVMTRHLVGGLALATLAFAVIGVGVSAAGTALLTLLAGRTVPGRRPAAATIAWMMMIAGFVVTAAVAGKLLDPFSPARLVRAAVLICAAGFGVTCLAVWGVEGRAPVGMRARADRDFRAALSHVWADAEARRFAAFVFVAMLAYGGEELMIEPFAGATFAMPPGETARLSGLLHGGSLLGMVLVAAVCGSLAGRVSSGRAGRDVAAMLRVWMAGGCLASGAALAGLALCGLAGNATALRPLLLALGIGNGAFAVAAVASMMQLVGVGADGGTRMGLWGAAQGVAFGCGGLAVTALSDILRHLAGGQGHAYAAVFGTEALGFIVAAGIAATLPRRRARAAPLALAPAGPGG